MAWGHFLQAHALIVPLSPSPPLTPRCGGREQHYILISLAWWRMQVPERQHFLVTWAHWGWINHMPIDMAGAEWPTLIVTVVRGQKAPRGLPHLHQNWTDVQAASDTRPDPSIYTDTHTQHWSPTSFWCLCFCYDVKNTEIKPKKILYNFNIIPQSGASRVCYCVVLHYNNTKHIRGRNTQTHISCFYCFHKWHT